MTPINKSFLTCTLARQACRQQRSVLYRRAPDLVSDLTQLRDTPACSLASSASSSSRLCRAAVAPAGMP